MKRITPVTLAALAVLLLALGGSALAKTLHGSWQADDGRQLIIVDDDNEVHVVGDEGKGAYLGVTLADLDDEEAAGKAGVRVQSVFDDTPAATAGLEPGDVILEFDGKKVRAASELVNLVREREPGATIKIKARRDGDSKTFKVTLGERERSFTLRGKGPWMHFGDGDDEKLGWAQALSGLSAGGRLGVEVRDLGEGLEEYFPGTDKGALVLSVEEDSPAAEAGLRAGDVIVSLGGKTVADVDDLRAAVRTLAGEDAGRLDFVRKGKRQDVLVAIPEADRQYFSRHPDAPGAPRALREYRFFGDKAQERSLQAKLEALEARLQQLEQRLSKDSD